MRTALLSLLSLAISSSAVADTIHLKSGGTLEGVVLRQNEDRVTVLLKYGIATLNSFDIASVERTPAAPDAKAARLADWMACLQALASRPWGPELQKRPALVISDGPQKNVPYVLFSTDERQFSLFGDPDAPAALELGVSGTLRLDERARAELVELMSSFLHDPRDAQALRSLSWNGERKDLGGLVIEIDQEPDARGKQTWWISVSDPKALDQARVSDPERKSISTAEPPAEVRNPTLVEKPPTPGQKVPQEVITPFSNPREKSSHRHNTGGGGGYWGGHIRWHHGHVAMTPHAPTGTPNGPAPK